MTTAYWVAAFLTVAGIIAAIVWTLSLILDLGTCGSAPICGPLRETVVWA